MLPRDNGAPKKSDLKLICPILMLAPRPMIVVPGPGSGPAEAQATNCGGVLEHIFDQMDAGGVEVAFHIFRCQRCGVARYFTSKKGDCGRT